MAKRALITGVTGQVGAYLAEQLLQKGYTVLGIVRRTAEPNLWRLDELGITSDVEIITGDITDAASALDAVHRAAPQEIYNLASQSSVGRSWKEPTETYSINTLGTVHLLDAMQKHDTDIRFFQASSSEMLGKASGTKQDEHTPLQPQNPYAISKAAAHWMTKGFRDTYNAYACCGIAFNHESPLRSTDFVFRKISDGIARISLGLADRITLGNLDAKRDWGLAPDFAKAMWLMLQQDKPDDYIIATGKTHSIRDILTAGFTHVGITDWQQYIEVDPQFLRPHDIDVCCGNSTKAQTELGWQPSVSFTELCEFMVDADLKRLQSSVTA